MESRAQQAKVASRTLYESDSSLGTRIVRLSEPEKLVRPRGYLIQVGEPLVLDGEKAWPRKVRGLLWELRSARFVDEWGAIMWALYDVEEAATYVGVGMVTEDEVIAERARLNELTVMKL